MNRFSNDILLAVFGYVPVSDHEDIVGLELVCKRFAHVMKTENCSRVSERMWEDVLKVRWGCLCYTAEEKREKHSARSVYIERYKEFDRPALRLKTRMNELARKGQLHIEEEVFTNALRVRLQVQGIEFRSSLQIQSPDYLPKSGEGIPNPFAVPFVDFRIDEGLYSDDLQVIRESIQVFGSSIMPLAHDIFMKEVRRHAQRLLMIFIDKRIPDRDETRGIILVLLMKYCEHAGDQDIRRITEISLVTVFAHLLFIQAPPYDNVVCQMFLNMLASLMIKEDEELFSQINDSGVLALMRSRLEKSVNLERVDTGLCSSLARFTTSFSAYWFTETGEKSESLPIGLEGNKRPKVAHVTPILCELTQHRDYEVLHYSLRGLFTIVSKFPEYIEEVIKDITIGRLKDLMVYNHGVVSSGVIDFMYHCATMSEIVRLQFMENGILYCLCDTFLHNADKELAQKISNFIKYLLNESSDCLDDLLSQYPRLLFVFPDRESISSMS